MSCEERYPSGVSVFIAVLFAEIGRSPEWFTAAIFQAVLLKRFTQSFPATIT